MLSLFILGLLFTLQPNALQVKAQVECLVPYLKCCPSHLPPCPGTFTTSYRYPYMPTTFTSSPSPSPTDSVSPTSSELPGAATTTTSTYTTTVYVTGTGTGTATSPSSMTITSPTTTACPITATTTTTSWSTSEQYTKTYSTTFTTTLTRMPPRGTLSPTDSRRPPLPTSTPVQPRLPQCSSGNLGRQACYNRTSFVICNTDQKWTAPLSCPLGTECKPYPGNNSFILCDFSTALPRSAAAAEEEADPLFFRKYRDYRRQQKQLKRYQKRYGARPPFA